jgi:hypothetical protein
MFNFVACPSKAKLLANDFLPTVHGAKLFCVICCVRNQLELLVLQGSLPQYFELVQIGKG